jgi:transcriptional regulator with GAF, ATPase, and Fis domain
MDAATPVRVERVMRAGSELEDQRRSEEVAFLCGPLVGRMSIGEPAPQTAAEEEDSPATTSTDQLKHGPVGIAEFLSALDSAREAGRLDAAARSHETIGNLSLASGFLARARRHFLAALHIYTWEHPSDRGRVSCQRNLADVYFRVGQLRNSIDALAGGLRVAGRCGWVEETARIRLEIAGLLVIQGDRHRAESRLPDWAEVSGSHDSGPLKIRHIVLRSKILALQGGFSGARSLLEAALGDAAVRGRGRAEVLLALAALCLEEKAPDESLLHLKSASSELYRCANAKCVPVETAAAEVRALMMSGKISAAAERLAAVSRQVETIGSVRHIAEVRRLMGCVSGLRGLHSEAREHFGAAVDVLSATDLFLDLGQTICELAREIISVCGGAEDAAEAAAFLCRAKLIFRKLRLERNEAEAHRLLSSAQKIMAGRSECGLCSKPGRMEARAAEHGLITAQKGLLHDVAVLGKSDVRVLIEGETGTGKELVAETIHRMSGRSSGPFVVLDCASLSQSLAASELFGHARGSFTGALFDRRGLVEAADGGTLFIDEVGELGSELQGHLLRVLQEGMIRRIGTSQYRRIDLRIVSATRRDLTAEVKRGTFRADLYYRLRGARIRIPPLRKRPEDIPLLIDHFVKRCTRRGEAPFVLSRACMGYLLGYHWPGNVRELESLVESIAAVCGSGAVIALRRLQGQLGVAPIASSEGADDEREPTLREKIEALERQEISAVLEHADGNKKRAARILGLTTRGLRMKIVRLGLGAADM